MIDVFIEGSSNVRWEYWKLVKTKLNENSSSKLWVFDNVIITLRHEDFSSVQPNVGQIYVLYL